MQDTFQFAMGHITARRQVHVNYSAGKASLQRAQIVAVVDTPEFFVVAVLAGEGPGAASQQ
jgi:hypothetical protein